MNEECMSDSVCDDASPKVCDTTVSTRQLPLWILAFAFLHCHNAWMDSRAQRMMDHGVPTPDGCYHGFNPGQFHRICLSRRPGLPEDGSFARHYSNPPWGVGGLKSHSLQ